MLNLRRAPSVVAEAPPLDDVQLAALAHRGGVLRVLGGPGTGKTTTAIEAVVARVESGEATPDQCLILTSSRVAAGSLRERVTARLAGRGAQLLVRRRAPWTLPLRDARLWIETLSPLCGAWIIRPRPM